MRPFVSLLIFFCHFLFVFILSDGCFIFIHLLKVESRNIKAVDPLSKHSFCGCDSQEYPGSLSFFLIVVTSKFAVGEQGNPKTTALNFL